VTYDITDRESFSAIENWMNEVEKHASDNISRILVGNKCDMEDSRQVSSDEGRELAEHYNVRFLETSAKDCKNVEEAFIMMTREIKSRVAITQPKRPAQGKITYTNPFVETQAQRIQKGQHQTKKLDQKKNSCC
jgi:GTPase SAR1 family protein